MALQIKLTNRRQFLGRSALGAGGLLFTPLLLDSCTDHLIPPDKPTNPVHVPTANGGIDWNNDAKNAVTTALQLVPDVGGFVSALVDLVWPDTNSPWNQVKAQVEQLIDQELHTDDYNRVTGNLQGLNGVINDYNDAIIDYNKSVTDYQNDPKIKKPDPSDLRTSWITAYNDFDLYKPDFKQNGDEVLLLPLYAQFANLNLALIRDLVVRPDPNAASVIGIDWGFTPDEIGTYIERITDLIKEFTDWTTTWYNTGRTNILNNTAEDDLHNEPFTSVNRYDRTMTMLVLDYMDTWKYYDIIQYPDGANTLDGKPLPLFTREIYSDPSGNTLHYDNDNSPIVLPSPATQFPTKIYVWAGSRIDAVQLFYPAGGGPGGADQTPRMGDQNGGSLNVIEIKPGWPIIRALVSSDDTTEAPLDQTINTLQFIFSDGISNSLSVQMGKYTGKYQSGNIGPDYYALSSIYIHGVDRTRGDSADCIVFGFMRWPRR